MLSREDTQRIMCSSAQRYALGFTSLVKVHKDKLSCLPLLKDPYYKLSSIRPVLICAVSHWSLFALYLDKIIPQNMSWCNSPDQTNPSLNADVKNYDARVFYQLILNPKRVIPLLYQPSYIKHCTKSEVFY